MKENQPNQKPPRKLTTLFAFAQIAAMAGTAVDFLFYIGALCKISLQTVSLLLRCLIGLISIVVISIV